MTQVIAEAQPNIALIKYWGKRDIDRNLPAVDSLSVTLRSLWTRMSVEFSATANSDQLQVNGAEAPTLLQRVTLCLNKVCGSDRPAAIVTSDTNFPIGAGLASSASAFAALVVAADGAAGLSHDRIALGRLAGATSGSAARSLFGGVVTLRNSGASINIQQLSSPDKWPLEIVIAVTEENEKPVGSGEAMIRSATTSPFYRSWLREQGADFETASNAVRDQDFASLAAVAEHNCLKMHSVMWTSRPPVVYWNKATLACMESIRQLQADGVPVFFTIDAGPQVKAVCLPEAATIVRDALTDIPGVVRIMQSGLGAGARILAGR